MSLIIAGIKNRKFYLINYYLYKDLLVELFCVFRKINLLNFKGVINLGSGIPVKLIFFR